MHRLALALFPLSVVAGCSDNATDCADCATTESTFGLDHRTVHDARSRDFVAADDGVTYTLIRVEYGDTPECSEWDDGESGGSGQDDCWYSTYCGFVVENQDYPLEVDWVTDADQLFDPAQYCEDGDLEGCELPGQLLPILDDADFETWMYETDPDEDVLVDCFADYW